MPEIILTFPPRFSYRFPMNGNKIQHVSQPLLVLLLALSAVAMAYIVSSQIYQHRPLTTDENSYLFQAQNFLQGRIARSLPEIPRAFQHSMIIMDRDAGWLSRYPPAHALWLMPGVLVGYPYLMSLLGAAIGIFLVSRIAVRLTISAPFAAALLVVSPFYMFIYGSLLSHTSGFLVTAAMLLCYIRWQQEQRTTDAALAGLFWGLLFLNRTYTALLLAIPFGIDASMLFFNRRNLRACKGCCSFAGVSLVFIGLYRLYNKVASGSSRMPTFLLYDPSEGLGFGPRHTEGLVVHHTFAQGIQNVLENLVIMDQWIWGIRGGLALTGLLVLIGWRKRWSPLFITVPLFTWFGYIYFWFAGIEHFRPVYFFETLVFIIIGAALGLDRILKISCPSPAKQRILYCLAPAFLLVAGIPFLQRQARFFHDHNHEARMVYEMIQTAPPQSLVLLEGFERKPLGENMLNLKGLDSDPLVARSNPFWNDVLATLYPERRVFILSPNTDGLLAYQHADPARYFILAHHTHRRTGTDMTSPHNTITRIATPDHPPGFLLFGRYPYLTPGRWRIRMQHSLDKVKLTQPVRLEIAADRGHTILQDQDLHGSATNALTDIVIDIDAMREIEPRVRYGGSGHVWIESITVERID